jgi:Flp pilus assembly protein TadG
LHGGIKVKRKRSERGATIAETAVTVLSLFFLLFGALEVGRIYSIYQTLTDAAREGARYAVAPDASTETLPSQSAITTHITPFFTASNITNTTVSLTATSHTVNGVTVSYSNVTVSAKYNFFFLPFAAITISSNSEMRNETN